MGDKKKKLPLPRKVELGDIIYLVGMGEVWIRQDDKDTYCFDCCYSDEEFYGGARLLAQAAGLFDVKEIEMKATIAYEIVEEEEEKEVPEADEIAAEEE